MSIQDLRDEYHELRDMWGNLGLREEAEENMRASLPAEPSPADYVRGLADARPGCPHCEDRPPDHVCPTCRGKGRLSLADAQRYEAKLRASREVHEAWVRRWEARTFAC